MAWINGLFRRLLYWETERKYLSKHKYFNHSPILLLYINKKHPICCFLSPQEQKTAAFPNILFQQWHSYQALDGHKARHKARSYSCLSENLVQFAGSIKILNWGVLLLQSGAQEGKQLSPLSQRPGSQDWLIHLVCSVQSGKCLRQWPRKFKGNYVSCWALSRHFWIRI